MAVFVEITRLTELDPTSRHYIELNKPKVLTTTVVNDNFRSLFELSWRFVKNFTCIFRTI